MAYNLRENLGKLQALQIGSSLVDDELPIMIKNQEILNKYYGENTGNCNKNYCNDISDTISQNKCNELINDTLCNARNGINCKSISQIVDEFSSSVNSDQQKEILQAALKQRLCGEVTALMTDKELKPVGPPYKKVEKSQKIFQIYYYLFDNFGYRYSSEYRNDNNLIEESKWSEYIFMFVLMIILFVIGLFNIHSILFSENKILGYVYLLFLLLGSAIAVGIIHNNVILAFRSDSNKDKNLKQTINSSGSINLESISNIYGYTLIPILILTLVFYMILNFKNGNSLFDMRNNSIPIMYLLLLAFLIPTVLFNIMYMTKLMLILTLISIIINLLIICSSGLSINKVIGYIFVFIIIVLVGLKIKSSDYISELFMNDLKKHDINLPQSGFNRALIPFILQSVIVILLLIKSIGSGPLDLEDKPINIFNVFGLDAFTKIIYQYYEKY